MTATVSILVILALSLIGYWLGRSRALAQEQSSSAGRLQALPQYYGCYVALSCGLPALALLLVWLLAQGPVVDRLLLASLSDEMTAGASPAQIDLLIATFKIAAVGIVSARPTRRSRRPPSAMARCGAAPGRRSRWSCSRSPSPAWFGPGTTSRRAFARAMRSSASSAPFGPVLGGRDPDHPRHRPVAAVRKPALLRRCRRTNSCSAPMGARKRRSAPTRCRTSGAFGAVPLFWGTIIIGAIIAMIVASPMGLICGDLLSRNTRQPKCARG